MNSKGHFSAILLAAGLSSRMGSPKQLLQINGATMLDRAVETALAAGIDKPVVVLGHNASEIQHQTELLHKCKVVINESYQTGMSTSLRCGVAATTAKSSAYLFMLIDQPLVDGTLVRELLRKFEQQEADILYPEYQGKRGNPVIISSKLRGRLLEAKGDSGARFLFTDKALNIIAHPVSTPAVIIDVDTPEDLRNYKKLHLFDKDR
ncbi:nucleotidyltransferase family protein [Desulforhopalus sp. 52FAK]